MERILYELTHSPFRQTLTVAITLGICDTDTPLNQVLFRIFLDYVLPEEIQTCCNFFVVFHERGIYVYTLESIILM